MEEILTKAIADQEKYDNAVKEIFEQPKIVATILRLAVPEFQGMSVEEIRKPENLILRCTSSLSSKTSTGRRFLAIRYLSVVGSMQQGSLIVS